MVIENEPLGWLTPILDIVAGAVPVFLATKLRSADCVIITGLKTTELLVEPRVMVLPPTTYENAS